MAACIRLTASQHKVSNEIQRKMKEIIIIIKIEIQLFRINIISFQKKLLPRMI